MYSLYLPVAFDPHLRMSSFPWLCWIDVDAVDMILELSCFVVVSMGFAILAVSFAWPDGQFALLKPRSISMTVRPVFARHLATSVRERG